MNNDSKKILESFSAVDVHLKLYIFFPVVRISETNRLIFMIKPKALERSWALKVDWLACFTHALSFYPFTTFALTH